MVYICLDKWHPCKTCSIFTTVRLPETFSMFQLTPSHRISAHVVCCIVMVQGNIYIQLLQFQILTNEKYVYVLQLIWYMEPGKSSRFDPVTELINSEK